MPELFIIQVLEPVLDLGRPISSRQPRRWERWRTAALLYQLSAILLLASSRYAYAWIPARADGTWRFVQGGGVWIGDAERRRPPNATAAN